jgi:hypothetical protein
VVGTLTLVGALGAAPGVVAALGFAGTSVLAVRTNLKMRGIDAERRQLEAAPTPEPLPARSSAARQPMERLEDAQDTLRELLRQLDSAALTSIPTDSVEQARATGAEAASAIRAVSRQLQAVERARDTAPPLDRAPLVEGVRRLRAQLDEGVDGYCGLVAAAGRVLAESTASNPRQVLGDATDHLAGLASASCRADLVADLRTSRTAICTNRDCVTLRSRVALTSRLRWRTLLRSCDYQTVI